MLCLSHSYGYGFPSHGCPSHCPSYSYGKSKQKSNDFNWGEWVWTLGWIN